MKNPTQPWNTYSRKKCPKQWGSLWENAITNRFINPGKLQLSWSSLSISQHYQIVSQSCTHFPTIFPALRTIGLVLYFYGVYSNIAVRPLNKPYKWSKTTPTIYGGLLTSTITIQPMAIRGWVKTPLLPYVGLTSHLMPFGGAVWVPLGHQGFDKNSHRICKSKHITIYGSKPSTIFWGITIHKPYSQITSYSHKNSQKNNWLVVYLPLWKIWVRQFGWWHSQYDGKVITAMFQTTNQYIDLLSPIKIY